MMSSGSRGRVVALLPALRGSLPLRSLHSTPSPLSALLRPAASPSPSSLAAANERWRTFFSVAGAGTAPPSSTGDLLHSPWSVVQNRGFKILGSDVRRGDIIRRKGRVFQVLEALHTHHGRGGATIQVELRDIDSGNKISERFRTEESIDRIFVEEKRLSFLYLDGGSIFMMDPDTFEQMEISKDLLGKAAAYLKVNMMVTIQLYDGKPMSASIPRRVTCTISEVQPYSKGQSASPQYKRVLLDNGITIHAPSYMKTGEKVIVDTTTNSYVTRDRE